jgi:hypothetical protein
VPTTHRVQPPAPSAPLEPGLQVHTFEVEPVTAENLPVSHAVHAAAPGEILKVPTAHGAQPDAPSGPVSPALHAHTLVVEPVTAENLPVPHAVHAADPGLVLYVPERHKVHVGDPSDPVDPALHVHTFEMEPVIVENFPNPQPVHSADPDKGL